MELRHLRYFIAVAEELNFTRAARKVGIGQPPLSNQIRDLENEIGAALFRRLSNGAELTEAGKAFLPEAQAILLQAEQAKQSALRAARGRGGGMLARSIRGVNPRLPTAGGAGAAAHRQPRSRSPTTFW